MAKDKEQSGPVSLAEAATATLGDAEQYDGAAQSELEGMDYTKVRFVGVQYDSLEKQPAMGTEMEFLVKGRVVGHGEEEMSDGHLRKYAKVKVSSVTLKDENVNG